MSNRPWFTDALLINRDPNYYRMTGWDYTSAETAEATMRSFFSKFGGHSITDVQLCVFENSSMLPSEAVMWRGLKYLQTEENGFPVSYPELEGLYRLFNDYHLDFVPVFLEIMRKNNIRPWLTLRVNDAHFGGWDTAFLRDDFFYTAQKNGWMLGEEYGYFAHCLNYKYEPVRARMLGFIDELLEKYDFFGLELDFMRECHSFDYLHDEERHATMNAFLETVHDKLVAAGERYGHPVRLMIRLPRSIQDAYTFGFDVAHWVEKGWIDAVVPTPRWGITDSAIPVAEWKALVGENIAVFPGVEILGYNFTHTDAEMAKAYSAAWNLQGADGLYFNNHDYATPKHVQVYDLHRDTVLEGVRRYVVTYQDIAAVGNPLYQPLPLTVDGEASLPFFVGPIRPTDRLTVIAEIDGQPMSVSLNGQPIASAQPHAPITGQHVDHMDGDPVLITKENHTFAFAAPDFVTDDSLTITFHGKGTVTYLEFHIEAQ